jgi:phosphate transport system substrate-binding protein
LQKNKNKFLTGLHEISPKAIVMRDKKVVLAVIVLTAGIGINLVNAQGGAGQITIAGGFTPAPLMLKAGEKFVNKAPQYKPPQFLNNDTTTGFKLFCSGAGPETPSLNAGTRDVRPSELELCDKNGVKGVVQLNLGRDALVVAQASGGRLKTISRKDFFLAVAKDVPDPKDSTKLIPNPYKTWKSINSDLPDSKIQVLAPEATVGLYQTYMNSLIMVGCRQVESLKALEASDPKAFDAACKTFRKDGSYTEFTKVPDAIQELKASVDTVGVVALTMVLKNNLTALVLDGMEPNVVKVSRNEYELTFSMQVFLKRSHIGVIPGLKEYLTELTSEEATGLVGYFYDMGVIPLPANDRKKVRAEVTAL